MMQRPPAFWSDEPHAVVRLLTPLSLIWRGITQWRLAHGARRKTPIPSICIGNAVAGGAGKTPTALALARLLQNTGAKPAFGNRGYGVKLQEPCIRVDPARHNAADVGDEALLLAAQAPCYVSADRFAACQAAASDGATHMIYDDGLQNPTIAYDHALLVLDGDYGVGNGRVIPAGPLREPLRDALARCDAALIIGADRHDLAAQCAGKPVLHGTIVPQAAAVNHNLNYLAFAGIGRPEKFFASCRALGLKLVQTRSYPDHHAFTAKELVGLAQAAMEQQAQLITTAKDAARLSPAWRERVTVLPVALQLDEPEALLKLVS